jgi:heme/copper-type cytochrome/quinol oxidase subunit 2
VLRKVMIAALVGNVLAHTYLQIAILHTLIPPLAITLVLTLVVAGIVATRWRWDPLLGVLWCIVSVIPGLEPYTFNLTHPTAYAVFVETLVSLALLFIAVVAGVAATISGERPVAEGRTPRWLRGFLIGTAAFVLGASLIAAIPQAEATAGVSAEALARLPALTTAHYTFDQAELRAKVGQPVALRLENSDAGAHSFDIDELNVHVPMPAGTPALALFKPSAPGTYTFYCSVPGHSDAGMVGTLIVEP